MHGHFRQLCSRCKVGQKDIQQFTWSEPGKLAWCIEALHKVTPVSTAHSPIKTQVLKATPVQPTAKTTQVKNSCQQSSKWQLQSAAASDLDAPDSQGVGNRTLTGFHLTLDEAAKSQLGNFEGHLLGQLLGYRLLEAAQHEGPQHLVQPVGHQQRLFLIQHGRLIALIILHHAPRLDRSSKPAHPQATSSGHPEAWLSACSEPELRHEYAQHRLQETSLRDGAQWWNSCSQLAMREEGATTMKGPALLRSWTRYATNAITCAAQPTLTVRRPLTPLSQCSKQAMLGCKRKQQRPRYNRTAARACSTDEAASVIFDSTKLVHRLDKHTPEAVLAKRVVLFIPLAVSRNTH
ncbi:MAG: hypothetical protein FRX49_04411 [Trebouxia sp. A1-2]|nr:MAG: hypothetical protein FRX49_04411 [Trebouxia sp. A1-2]